jgi:hypothetical protein
LASAWEQLMHRRALLMAMVFLAGLSLVASGAHGDDRSPAARHEEAAAVSATVVFWEEGFPSADTAAPTREQIKAMLPAAAITDANHLAVALTAKETRLLVMPYGSAFPEEDWDTIHSYLERGGNLLVLGGRPFTRAAYKENNSWKLRPAIQAFARTLFLNDYQETPGSDGLAFTPNEDFSFLKLPTFAWKRAWSATVRLTDEDLYKREGSAGTLDTRLDALAWGVANGRRLAAPVIELDHLQNHFVGGRWVFVGCELGDRFYANAEAGELVRKLAERAADSAEDFTVQPAMPLFLPGELPTFTLRWRRFGAIPRFAILTTGISTGSGVWIELNVAPEGGNSTRQRTPIIPEVFPFTTQILLPANTTLRNGLYSVTATLHFNDKIEAVYRTGFWMRDEELLRTGLKVGVDKDYFTIAGKPVLVAGTTYMASDVQRQFFLRPNPWLWDRDMAEIHAAGMNMLRTGWWTAWDQVMKESGDVSERMLRTMEAYLLTARHNGLAVQFTFFAFTPDVFGGENPYLDPEAVRRQKELILAFAERFRDVPFLAWDLINEPSFSNPQRAWQTRPNGDVHELAAWNAWLNKHYANHGAIAEAWRSLPLAEGASVPLPAEAEFSSHAAYEAWPSNNSLRAMDYQHFAQDTFRGWVMELRDAIRAAGSKQLVTVGQDEGGGFDRPSPAFFGDAVDFTTTHSWWASDALLWDSLVAKQPGEPMLVQETGVSHEVRLDGEAHRSLTEETQLLERKLAVAAGTSAGAIQWLWNVNSYQRDDRETTIGALRPDGTEKPEAELLRRFARFAAAAGAHMAGALSPEVAIVTSQTLQLSPLGNLATEAQQKSVRALHYLCGVPAYVITENNLARLGSPKLVILPAAQALSDEAWNALLVYVSGGGVLLVTGSVERDAHWRVTQRLSALGAAAAPEPLLLRAVTQRIGTRSVALSFAFDKQQSAEVLRFADGETLHTVNHGRGRILIASAPVELAEGLQPAADLYLWALGQAGVQSPYIGQTPAGVLVRPVALADSVLYLIVSESANEETISVKDRVTGGEIRTKIAPGRAQLVLFSRSGGQVIARFGE